MSRHTRYQGAIVQDDHLLLIQHREHATGHAYWLVPGGGLEDGETEEECVRREMKEETNLDVEVKRLLFDEAGRPDGVYEWMKTYLCEPVSGEPAPGFEPEEEAAMEYSIAEVRWFDLRDEDKWGSSVREDPITYPLLQRLRKALGYLP